MGRRLDFKLTRPQSEAFRLCRTPTTDINLEWGRGGGKSWFDRFVGWTWAASADGKPRLDLLKEFGMLDRLNADQRSMAQGVSGIRVVFLMPTLKQFKDVHGAHLKNEVETWRHLRPKANWSEYNISFPGESWIMPFPAADHSSQRARGIRADVVICDEADDIDPSVFDSVVRPWFSEPWSLKIRLTSGTYKRGRHGLLYKRRLAGRDIAKPRYHTIHATYRDSPEIVDLEEVEDARRNTSPGTFAREWECDPDSSEGLVYAFEEAFHVKEPPANVVWTEMLIGCDHGWEHPGVLLLIGVIGSGRDAVCWVLEEIYEQHKDEDWWVARAKEWTDAYPNHRFYGDPSQPARLEAFRRRAKARVQDVDNSIDDGVGAVANRLAIRESEDGVRSARLFVSPSCPNTIREFGIYKRKPDPMNAEQFLDDIVKRDDDAMDALRYPIFNRFGPEGPSTRTFNRYDARS
ncbi:MAG TPA: hypothetical protein VGK73_08595 [Polyangiaceae bacterium]